MKKSRKNNEALTRQLAALFGDPASGSASEIQDVYEEIPGGSDLVKKAHDLALRAAQQYRLSGQRVPSHVEAAISQTKEVNTLEGVTSSKLSEIIDSALRPFQGPTQMLAFSFRGLTDKTSKDERLLEELA